MFSRRFASGSPESSPLWAERSRRLAAGETLLDLTRSNPTDAGFAYPSDLPALLSRPEVLAYHPDPKGLLSARQAVAAYLQGLRGGTAVDSGDLLLTASTSEAYSFLFKLLCDPGDEVLIPVPTYPLFDSLAALEHVSLVRYPLRPRAAAPEAPSHWSPDFARLSRIISTRTKALILVSPNNPTGHMADADEAAAYVRLARDYGLALIVDEVFSEYLFAGSRHHPVLSDGPLVFTLNGLSKLAGLPQLKLGWIHVAGEPSRVREALDHLEWIADAFLSVNTPVQAACADLLARAPALRAPIRARLDANLAASLSFASPRLHPLRPEAGWSMVLGVAPAGPGRDDEEFTLGLLRRHGVLLHPGHLFGFEEDSESLHVIASLLAPEAEFREGLQRLSAYAEESHG